MSLNITCFKFQHAGAAHEEVLHYAPQLMAEPSQFTQENEDCSESTREALNKPAENMILLDPKVQLNLSSFCQLILDLVLPNGYESYYLTQSQGTTKVILV